MVRDTSIEAYRTIKENGLLSKRRWQVYDVLFHHGPLTVGELWAWHLKDQGIQLNSISPRTSELLNFGVITEIRERKCRSTGNLSIEWDVTSRLPANFEKPKKTPCPHCDGRGYTMEQQFKLF